MWCNNNACRCITVGRCCEHEGIVGRNAKYFKYGHSFYTNSKAWSCLNDTKKSFPLWFHLSNTQKFVTQDTTWFCLPDTQKIISAMVFLVLCTKICYSGNNMILLARYKKNHFSHGFACPIHKKIVTRDTTLHLAPYPLLSPPHFRPPPPMTSFPPLKAAIDDETLSLRLDLSPSPPL